MIKIIGDKVIIQKQHKIKAKNLLPEVIHRFKNGEKYVVSIGGESGTGKTEIMLVLRNLLYKEGIKAQVISLDDYYKSNWIDRNAIRKENGIDSVGRSEIHWKVLDEVVKIFKSKEGSRCCIRRINKFTESIEYSIFDSIAPDILIIEGLYACYIQEADLRVYLEGTYQETKSFRLERMKEEQNDFRNQVLEKEHKEVVESKQFADIVVNFEGGIR